MIDRELNKQTYCQDCGLCNPPREDTHSLKTDISEEELSHLIATITRTVIEVLAREGKLK